MIVFARLMGLVIIVALVSSGTIAIAMTRSEVVAAIDDGIERLHPIKVGLRFREILVAEGEIFSGNICWPDDSEEAKRRCDRTLRDPDVVANAIKKILRQILPSERLGQISALRDGDRLGPSHSRFSELLAQELGISMTAAGWPAEVPTQIGVVLLPAGEGGSVLVEKGGSVVVPWSGSQLELTERTVVAGGERETQEDSLVHNRLAPPLEFFCDTEISQRTELTYVFNDGRSTVVETDAERLRNLSTIARQAGLSLQLRDETGQCGTMCRDAIAEEFIIAVAAWRSGCGRCSPDALSVVQFGRSVWILGDAMDRLRAVASRLEPPSELALQATPLVAGTSIAAPNIGVPISYRATYEPVTPTLRSAICGSPKIGVRWYDQAHKQLCDPAPSREAFEPKLVLKDGATACGPAEDVMACGEPDGTVEVAIGVTPYIDKEGKTLIGGQVDRVPARMGKVLLHEVGHWFGVPHHSHGQPIRSSLSVRERGDVMDNIFFRGAFCIGPASLVMLNNAADRRWPHRQTTGGALLTPR